MQCKNNFSTPRMNIPKIFRDNDCSKEGKRGRYKNDIRDEAFQRVCEYLESKNDETLTLSDLETKMGELLGTVDESSYSSKLIKKCLMEKYGDKIIFTEKPGKCNIVTLKHTAMNIIANFREEIGDVGNTLSEESKIKEAASIIKAAIMNVDQENDYYPSSEDMNDSNSLNFVPSCLRLFLESIFVGKHDVKIASIGQAIMQACRPRSLICPLQLGLGVQFHNQFQSRVLVDELHEAGFSIGYSMVQNFEKSAAVTNGVSIGEINDNSNLQYSADNVDVMLRTLDGKGTFHAMGMIAMLTPNIEITTRVKRMNVSRAEILKVGHVNI